MENLDEMIRKYSEALVEMGETYGGEAPLKNEKVFESAREDGFSETLAETTTESPSEENTAKPTETETEPPQKTPYGGEDEVVNTSPAVKEPLVTFPEGEATSSATFFTRVFTAEGAYPIESARVVVYRGDNIYAFLETDGEGRTKTVKLPAFERENSLEEENDRQSIEYFADVFATGFVTQKELLVSAVGGGDIVLNVLMIPEKEGIG